MGSLTNISTNTMIGEIAHMHAVATHPQGGLRGREEREEGREEREGGRGRGRGGRKGEH